MTHLSMFTHRKEDQKSRGTEPGEIPKCQGRKKKPAPNKIAGGERKQVSE